MESSNLFTFVKANFGMISLILLLILSEVLSFKPALGASGVVKLIYNLLQSEAKKSEPDAMKIIESELAARIADKTKRT